MTTCELKCSIGKHNRQTPHKCSTVKHTGNTTGKHHIQMNNTNYTTTHLTLTKN